MPDRQPKDQRQRERIEREFERNLLVEAGAGSGKTHSLARRMAAGIAAGVYHVEHMAAVTFTRKAASELRGRFQLALEEKLRDAASVSASSGGPGSDERAAESARLVAALGNLERFFAGTIHAFCAQLLRERPVESGIAPGFSELDEPDDVRMREQSWRDYITRAKASGSAELLALLDAGIRAKDLDPASKLVCLHQEVEFPAGSQERPDVATAWSAAITFWDMLQPLVPLQISPDSKCKVLDKAGEFARILNVASPGDPVALVRALELWQGTSLKVTYKWWTGNDGHVAAKLLSDFRDAVVLPFLTAWREYVYDLAVRVLLEAREHAASERRRHNALNYGDLLQHVAAVLRDHSNVRRALQRKYRWLFVDEFQDTDPVQAEIILLLASDSEVEPDVGWREVSLRPGALFVVGDPKQSIYRFRRADIDIYDQVKQRIVETGGEVIPLTANFRSVGVLCEWANGVFKARFPDSARNHAPAFERLDAFRQDADTLRFGVRTLTIPDTVAEYQVSQCEADAIARYIRDEVAAGRRAFGDFLLLTRKKKPLATYARVLEGHGIPVEVSGAGAFGASEEVHYLAVLLRALADPQDAISLVGVLRGPFFGLSDPELFAYVQAGGRLWLFDKPAASDSFGPHALPVANALEQLRALHRLTRLLPAAAAVERILEQTGYLALAASKRGGGEAGDLLHAIDRIRQVSEDGGTLMEGVESLEEDAEASSDIDSVPLEPGRTDVVRLMNLHKAKGLEAAVVFLADPCGGFKSWPDVRIVREGQRAQGYFQISAKFESGGSRVLAHPAGWEVHCQKEQAYLDAEADRLLYVAATRAKDLLIVARWAKAGGRGTRAWADFEPWLMGVPELKIPTVVAQAVPVAPDLTATACAAAAARRVSAVTAALTPSWAISSVTAEARHISKVVRRAEGEPDDPTTTITQDTPTHRADAGMAWGALIHGLLEHAMHHKEASREDLRRLAMWLTVEEPQLRAVVDEALDTVQRVATAEFWAEATAGEHTVEAPFVFAPAPGSLSSGVIDLLFRNDRWHVVDYKTDIGFTSGSSGAYAQQMKSYENALKSIGIENVETTLQNVRASDQ